MIRKNLHCARRMLGPALFSLLMLLLSTAALHAQSCADTVTGRYVIRWTRGDRESACQLTLRPDAVVRVMIHGANPAVADYSLTSVTVRDITFPSLPRPEKPPETPAKAAPDVPDVEVETMAPAANGMATLWTLPGSVTPAQQRALAAITDATRLAGEIEAYFASLKEGSWMDLCRSQPGAVVTTGSDFWYVAHAIDALTSAMRSAVHAVLPPVTGDRLRASQTCVTSLPESWNAILTNGSGIVARTYTDSRTTLEGYLRASAAARDSLSRMVPTDLPDAGRESREIERARLIRRLGSLHGTIERTLTHDLTDATLAETIASLDEANKWVDLIMDSDTVWFGQTTVDGTRGRSRNIVVSWKPGAAAAGLPVGSGEEVVIVDRFRGPLLNASWSGGIAGVRRHETLRRAIVSDSGLLRADSVELFGNSHIVWGPALSAGASLTYHWRSGFYGGVGLDLMIVTEDDGSATTRIAAPVLHFGRDDIRIFIAPILGPRHSHALDNDTLRLGAADPIPENLVLRNTHSVENFWDLFTERLYLGIVIGKVSMDPSAMKK